MSASTKSDGVFSVGIFPRSTRRVSAVWIVCLYVCFVLCIRFFVSPRVSMFFAFCCCWLLCVLCDLTTTPKKNERARPPHCARTHEHGHAVNNSNIHTRTKNILRLRNSPTSYKQKESGTVAKRERTRERIEGTCVSSCVGSVSVLMLMPLPLLLVAVAVAVNGDSGTMCKCGILHRPCFRVYECVCVCMLGRLLHLLPCS